MTNLTRRNFLQLFAAMAAVGTMSRTGSMAIEDEEMETEDEPSVGDKRVKNYDDPHSYFCSGRDIEEIWNGREWKFSGWAT